MTSGATLDTEQRDNHVILTVTGELDVFNAADIAELIEAAVPTEAHAAVLDLTAVGFLDSTAIRKLFGLTTRLAGRRQGVHVVTPTGSTVLRTLQLVDFQRAAPIHDTLDAALAEIELGAAESA